MCNIRSRQILIVISGSLDAIEWFDLFTNYMIVFFGVSNILVPNLKISSNYMNCPIPYLLFYCFDCLICLSLYSIVPFFRSCLLFLTYYYSPFFVFFLVFAYLSLIRSMYCSGMILQITRIAQIYIF